MQTESRPLLNPKVNTVSSVEPSVLKNNQKFRAGLALFLASSLLVAGGWWYRHEWASETSQHAASPLFDYVSQKEVGSSDSEEHEDEGYTDSALADEITALPGINVDTLDFRQFSGYLDANEGRQLFYWFVESQNDPDNDPLLMWTNGKQTDKKKKKHISLLGLLSEHGPFWVDPNLQLYVNDYAWNKRVNIFYIEQPYGVGFSVTGGDDYVIGDRNASLDMDAAIRSFLVKFPKYLHHPLSISGESYAGHYLPTLALTILTNNDDGYNPRINFKGLLVGMFCVYAYI
ncbi:hypothetical protein RFI_22776 [Reticulomyxa filosa]|uniref:Carboxypeptidase n=1 Tax=Reticulomyxa filosa TaxID=46433 RepID=X6MLQ7_RETFI|nr:hypothetical protein RFI_22776 [Reticulomyxa filosa]|eukprot:ETO14591.1 hypothetical protein RFI_22776 [Reticulomyxa filosa]